MNTLVYADVTEEQASSASTIASTMQQMSISFGVATASLATAYFIPDRFRTSAPDMIHGIHRIAFLVLGGLTVLSAIIFRELKKEDGDTVSLHKGPAARWLTTLRIIVSNTHVIVTVSARTSRARTIRGNARPGTSGIERARGWNNAFCNQAAQRSRGVNLWSQRAAISCVAAAQVNSPRLNFTRGSSASSADSKAIDMPLPVTGGIMVMASPTQHSFRWVAHCGRRQRPATEQKESSSK